MASASDTPQPGANTDPKNVNGTDQAKAAAAAKDAQKAPTTIAAYRILHEMVGGRRGDEAVVFARNDVVSAADLGGEKNLERLFKHGAIALVN